MTTEQPMPILDDSARMQLVDKRNMLRLIDSLPEQCETALTIGRNFQMEPLLSPPNVVFITGVGDSSAAAEMAAAILNDEIEMPLLTDNGGKMPKCVNEESLVIIIDYAGKSAASLRNYKEAKQRNCKIICITSGGILLETAVKDETKVIKILPGQPARTALGYLFMPMIAALQHCGIVSGMMEKLSYAVLHLKNVREELRFQSPTSRNIAKQTAERLIGKSVMIYGASGYRSIVANRWKTQLNANSKTQAFAGNFPEAAGTEISGWEQSEKQCKNVAFVYIKDLSDKTEISSQMNATQELLADYESIELNLKGTTVVEKMLYGMYLADYVSCYLALAYEVNPTTTEYVTLLDEKLSGPIE